MEGVFLRDMGGIMHKVDLIMLGFFREKLRPETLRYC
jgi:hypothetical protein